MNKTRRTSINILIADLKEKMSDIEDILSEEQYYLDNMPENLQTSSKAGVAEEAINNLEDAISSLDDAISSLEEAVL